MQWQKAKEILKEMFTQRGYTEISENGKTPLCAISTQGKVCVFLSTEKKMDNKELEEKIASLKSEGSKHGIVVYREPPTRNAVEHIGEYEKIGYHLELFNVEDLQYNITHHYLVPKHTLLNPRDTLEFKRKFGVKIPALLRTDPVCKFYDFPKGGIVRVERKSGCAGYRIVR